MSARDWFCCRFFVFRFDAATEEAAGGQEFGVEEGGAGSATDQVVGKQG